MAIIERTSNLNLTQFKGGSIKPAILDYYSSDMLKIDNAFVAMDTNIDEFEADVTASVTALETLVNSFDTRVSTLEDCCSDVNTTLLNYGSRLVEIERVIDTVSTANIDDIIERVNALENKVNTNITNINILRNDIHELDERMGVAESTLVQHATDITNQGNRIATLEDCCGTVNSELVRIEGKVDSNKGEIDGIKTRLDRDEVNIAGNANDITILSQQVDINTADIEDLKQGLAELDPTSQLEVVRQVAINTENISNLQTSVTAQASNLSTLTTRVARVEDDIVDLKADNVSLHNEIASVQGWESRIAGAEAVAQQASDDVATLTTEVGDLSDDVTALDSRVTTIDGNVSSVTGRVTTLESKVATDESAFTALETRVSANEADLTNIHATITDDESGLANVGNRVTALETQNGNTPLNTTAQTLSGGVNEVNTLVVNADSKATQALSTANSASATATQAITDAAQAVSDVSSLNVVVGDSSSGLVKDVADLQSDILDAVKGFTQSTYNAVTGLAYDATSKKLGLKVGADTVIPFSGTPNAYQLIKTGTTQTVTFDRDYDQLLVIAWGGGSTATIVQVNGVTQPSMGLNSYYQTDVTIFDYKAGTPIYIRTDPSGFKIFSIYRS